MRTATGPALANEATREVYVWYMGGSHGNVLLGGRSLSGGPIPGWKIAGAADFNGDGKPDLIWQNDVTRELQVWYIGGAPDNAYLGNGALSGPVPGWRCTGAADLNGDGKLDLLWQHDGTREAFIWYMGGALANIVVRGASISNGPVLGWILLG